MRELHVHPTRNIPTGTFLRLSVNSPGGPLCPKLGSLHWDQEEALNPLPFFRLFLSSHLKRVVIDVPDISEVLEVQTAALIQTISSLPTSIEVLTLSRGRGKDEILEDAISAFLCRCGSSLREFRSRVPLSEAAIHHIMQLPNFHSWIVVQEPPWTIPISVFPPLKILHLHDQAALPWLHLFASGEENTLRNGSTPMTSRANIRETLTNLGFPKKTILDSTFLSSVSKFQNLVRVYVDNVCYEEDGCTFHLTDDDVEDLAASLPRLQTLELGIPCHSNFCNTTVASLLSISTHCLDLGLLAIHFNTSTIAADMQRLLDGGSWRDKAKCKLTTLMVGYLPVEVGEEDNETVMKGLRIIFPCFGGFGDFTGDWSKLLMRSLGLWVIR